MLWNRCELINLLKRSGGDRELSQTTCSERATIPANSQTRKLVNTPYCPTHNLRRIGLDHRANTLVNSLTCQLVNLRPCQLFSANFNILSALSGHQPPTLPQKIDSREGLFWCKKGLVVHAGKMNFYLNGPPLTPVFGRFAAKCSAFWC